jgi:prophage antirepressor-like protein
MDTQKTTTGQVQVFEFEQRPVRVELFDGEPWWAAKDVMVALGYADSSEVHSTTAKVPDEWRGRKPFATPGGVQEMIALSEQGLYFFVARSNMPAALPFQKWIAGEVLPSIRQTGAYAVGGKALTKTQLLLLQVQAMAEQEERQREADARAAALTVRVDAIEARSAASEVHLRGLVEPTEDAGEVSVRKMVGRTVRSYCVKTDTDFGDAYRALYREFRDRFGVDLVARARHRGVSALDVAEAEAHLDRLYAVAYEIFVSKPLPKETGYEGMDRALDGTSVD